MVLTYGVGFFLVFAGMLIGWALWYRDRTEEIQARFELDRDNEELRNSLKVAHSAHSILDERFIRQKGQLNVLQQLCDDWSTSREQTERERAQLEVEAEDKRKKYEEAAAELNTEKQTRIELGDQIHHLNQQHLLSMETIEKDWRNKFMPVESSLSQHQSELSIVVKQNQQLNESLHKSNGQIAELKSEIDANQKLLETATSNASGLKQEYVSVESALKETNDLLKQSRSESATVKSEHHSARQTIESQRAALTQQKQQIKELESELAKTEGLQQKLESLTQTLQNNQQQLEKVSQQRDVAIKAEQVASTMGKGLQSRIDNQESTIHGLREKHKDAMENLKQELQLRSELETSWEKSRVELESRIQQQRKQTELNSGKLKSNFGQVKSQLEERVTSHSKLIEELSGQREELKTNLETANQKLANTKLELEKQRSVAARIKQIEQLLAQRDQDLAAKSAQLQSTTTRISDYQKRIAEREEQARQLAVDRENLQKQQAQHQQKMQELEAKLMQQTGGRNQLTAETNNRLNQITAKLKASEETIRTLRRERAGVLARLANYRTIAEPEATVISFTQAMEQRKPDSEYDAEYGGHTRHDEKRGLVYTSEPQSRDDLKRISGIAVILEARLNDFGIYTFKQIMDWKPEAIEEFGRLLTFRDRIERDDWKGQAQFFYNEKRAQQKVAA